MTGIDHRLLPYEVDGREIVGPSGQRVRVSRRFLLYESTGQAVIHLKDEVPTFPKQRRKEVLEAARQGLGVTAMHGFAGSVLVQPTEERIKEYVSRVAAAHDAYANEVAGIVPSVAEPGATPAQPTVPGSRTAT